MTGLGRALTMMAMLALAMPASAERPKVKRVPIEAPTLEVRPPDPSGKGAKRACVPVDAIAGAIVTSDRTVELRLRGGERWRMSFAEDCPALAYYQGFYYKRTQAGYLCAGRDAVMARSGGECPIKALVRTKRAPRK